MELEVLCELLLMIGLSGGTYRNCNQLEREIRDGDIHGVQDAEHSEGQRLPQAQPSWCLPTSQ